MEKSESVENLIQFVVDSVRQAHADDAPFHHLQRNHRPVLSAAGQFHAAYRDDLSPGAPKWTKTEEGADAVFAKYRLRVWRSREHLAFGRPSWGGGENAR